MTTPVVNEEAADEDLVPDAAPNTPKGEMVDKVNELFESLNPKTR